jgi:hypothetical protein
MALRPRAVVPAISYTDADTDFPLWKDLKYGTSGALRRQRIPAMSAPNTNAATAAAHRALELLSRASGDWRNGGGCESGALHWPVAVNLARRELRAALEALEQNGSGASACDGQLEDARAGIAWFNSLTPTERAHWLEIADSAVPADAWRAFQAGGPQP